MTTLTLRQEMLELWPQTVSAQPAPQTQPIRVSDYVVSHQHALEILEQLALSSGEDAITWLREHWDIVMTGDEGQVTQTFEDYPPLLVAVLQLRNRVSEAVRDSFCEHLFKVRP